MLTALLLSLSLNAALAGGLLWQRRRHRHLLAAQRVNLALVHEVERKLGPKKARRLVRSMANTIGHRETA